jgi:hypothetical protein
MTPDDAGDRGDPDADGRSEGGVDQGASGDGEGGDDPTTVSPDIEDPFPSVTAGSETPADRDDGGPGEFDFGEPAEPAPSPESPTEPEDSDGLGRHGWVLVGGLLVAMVLVPWAVVFLPQMQGFLGSLGLGVRDAYLVLPMVPALGLGILAVWAAIAYRRRE